MRLRTKIALALVGAILFVGSAAYEIAYDADAQAGFSDFQRGAMDQ